MWKVEDRQRRVSATTQPRWNRSRQQQKQKTIKKQMSRKRYLDEKTINVKTTQPRWNRSRQHQTQKTNLRRNR